jgi:hypothetical protein
MDAVEGYERTPENEAAEEAAFEAACNGTDQEPAAAVTEEDPKPEAVEALKQEAPPVEQAEPVKEPTVADLLAMIEEQKVALAEQKTARQQLNDKVFGKVGELQQKIDAMKGTAHGISVKARERLMTDFPELADMLFEVQEEPAATPAPAAVQVQATPAPATEDIEHKMERRLLARDHKDWESVVTSPGFQEWKAKLLKPEDSAALDTSWDADFISGKITEFKAHQVAEAKRATERQTKQQRMENAINPQGVPRVGAGSGGDDDEEAAMMGAYKPRR